MIKCNRNYFETINTEDKAYWLGFLYGDGTIINKPEKSHHYIRLELKRSDKSHLEKFKKCIKSNHNIRDIKQNFGLSSSIQIGSKKMVHDLIKLGCVPNKSKKLDKIPNIEEDLIRHFIRGLFDADGCVYMLKSRSRNKKILWEYPSIDFSGTKNFLESVLNFLLLHNVFDHKNNVRNNKSIYRFAYTGKYAEQFLDYIYNNSKIHLDRKYKKYADLK